MTKVTRQWHDRKKIIEVPLFPCYIFVEIDHVKDIFYCQTLDGVCEFVRSGKQLEMVSQTTIDQIKIITNTAETIEVSQNHFKKGERFYIEQGPLSGLLCEVVHHGGKDKILVRIDFFGRNLLIDLPVHYLALKAS